MPELPEVETILRSLAPRLLGRRILEAFFPAPLVLKGAPPPQLDGSLIRTIRRYGKFIVFDLDSGSLAIHLGMTGKLLYDQPPGPHTRAVFTLNDGNLLYDDIRMFGRIVWNVPLPNLGPDPLSLSEEDFLARLATRRGLIKPLLLNQAFLRGLGNIYTDEALFRAGLHPRARAERLRPVRARRLYRAIVELLDLAIQHRGSSISDYVDGQGNKGGFQLLHQVYGKEGAPCPACGTQIKRIVVAQRGTHYCPYCQRL